MDKAVGRIKIKLGHTVLDGDPAPTLPKGHSPHQFSAHIRCGQMARWIKTPLGMEVGLEPSDSVLDGDPAPLSKRGHSPQIFGPFLLWPNGRPSQLMLSTCAKAINKEKLPQLGYTTGRNSYWLTNVARLLEAILTPGQRIERDLSY